MPLVISWICAVLLWIVKDAHPLPQILTLRTGRDTKFEDPDLEEQNFSERQDFSEHDEASTVSHRSKSTSQTKSSSQSTPQIETAPADQLGFKQLGLEQLGLEQLPQSSHRLEVHSAVGNAIHNSRQTYWVMQAGAIQFCTTNRIEVADWIRIHGSRNLKVMTTSETDV